MAAGSLGSPGLAAKLVIGVRRIVSRRPEYRDARPLEMEGPEAGDEIATCTEDEYELFPP